MARAKSRPVIEIRRPAKGDIVKGHKVYIFCGDDLPAVPAEVISVAKSGVRVTVDVGAVYGALGLPRRTDWTWRESMRSYQQAGTRTRQGHGLGIAAKS